MQYSICGQQQQHRIKVSDRFYCAAQWQALTDTKARIRSLFMNKLTVRAYDEFGDDGDEVDKKDDKIEETKSAKDTTSEVEVNVIGMSSECHWNVIVQ